MSRAALGWSLERLSIESSVSVSTLKRLEGEGGIEKANRANLLMVKQTLEAAGIEFIGGEGEGPGVRLWDQGIAAGDDT